MFEREPDPVKDLTLVLFASAGGGAVRGAVDVCLRRRGPWGGCVGSADAGLRSRIERQGGGGRAFFCPYGGSPAAPGGEGGGVYLKGFGRVPGIPIRGIA